LLRQRIQEKAEQAGVTFSAARSDPDLLAAIETDEDALA
jgi:hypothetical protein